MNRIYQGRVTNVEILTPPSNSLSSSIEDSAKGEESKPAATWKAKATEDWQPLKDWENKLWQHHQLFQDAA